VAELTDKVILISGASSGIGEATARRLAKAGAHVVVVARRKDRLDKLVKDIVKTGGAATAINDDITSKAACQKIVEQVVKQHKRLDVLINNAGVMLNGPALKTPLEDWEQMVQLNLLGLLYMTHPTLAQFKKQGIGHLVNISSGAGRTVRSGTSVYNLTKGGVNVFTEALRQELAGSKCAVRTTLIEPGAVDTELTTHLRKEVYEDWKKNFGNITILEPDDIARAIEFALVQPPHVNVNEILIRPTEQVG